MSQFLGWLEGRNAAFWATVAKGDWPAVWQDAPMPKKAEPSALFCVSF